MSTLKVNKITGIVDFEQDVKSQGAGIAINFTVDSAGGVPDSSTATRGDWFFDNTNNILQWFSGPSGGSEPGSGWYNVGISDSSGAGAGGGAIYGTRGIIYNAATVGSGNGYNNSNVIEYFDISASSSFTCTDFGDMLEQSGDTPGSTCSNATRVVHQVYSSTATRRLQFVASATTGNATSFGEYDQNYSNFAAWHNGTYGYFAQQPSYMNRVDVITIATEGNATATGYGNADVNTLGQQYGAGAAGDTTRMIQGGGENNGYNTSNIQYIAMPVLADGATFGTLTQARRYVDGTADDTYSIWGGGYVSNAVSTIDYVTTQTTGNASSFGSLWEARTTGACTDGTKGCFVGGYNGSSRSSRIDYVTIATTGNATDFGDMTSGANHAKPKSGYAA